MSEEVWQTGPGGVLTAEIAGRFRLVVQGPAADGAVRFSVLRYSSLRYSPRKENGLLRFAGSGTAETVGSAMTAAENMAKGMPLRTRVAS